MNLLVDMGVYKNIDRMTDKEMFDEYEKLFKSAKRERRRLRRQGKARWVPLTAGPRSSLGSSDGNLVKLEENTSDSDSEYTTSSYGGGE